VIPCRAHAACARMPANRTPSQATPPETAPGVHLLGKCRPGVPADEDDLWTTQGRSLRRRRADLADSSVELTVRWQADPHRRRTSAKERKWYGSTVVPRCHQPAIALLRAVVLSVGRAVAEPTVAEKPSWLP
jgi:hypothetical protein